MANFILGYGEHVWAEYDVCLRVAPMLISGGIEMPFPSAIARGQLRKPDHDTFESGAEGIRIDVLMISDTGTEAFVLFLRRSSGVSISAKLWPSDLDGIGHNSGFIFSSGDYECVTTQKDIISMYSPIGARRSLTFTPEALEKGLARVERKAIKTPKTIKKQSLIRF